MMENMPHMLERSIEKSRWQMAMLWSSTFFLWAILAGVEPYFILPGWWEVISRFLGDFGWILLVLWVASLAVFLWFLFSYFREYGWKIREMIGPAIYLAFTLSVLVFST